MILLEFLDPAVPKTSPPWIFQVYKLIGSQPKLVRGQFLSLATKSSDDYRAPFPVLSSVTRVAIYLHQHPDYNHPFLFSVWAKGAPSRDLQQSRGKETAF